MKWKKKKEKKSNELIFSQKYINLKSLVKSYAHSESSRINVHERLSTHEKKREKKRKRHVINQKRKKEKTREFVAVLIFCLFHPSWLVCKENKNETRFKKKKRKKIFV